MTRTKVGIIFDDGFARSTLATAAIFEQYKLSAVFAVLADPSSFVPGCGDWTMWNDLPRRGHIIHPHGQTHAKLSDLPRQPPPPPRSHHDRRIFRILAAHFSMSDSASFATFIDAPGLSIVFISASSFSRCSRSVSGCRRNSSAHSVTG